MQDQPSSEPRRLTRSANRQLGGVCGGIADYFAVDPTLVRIGFVLLALLSLGGGALVAYAVLWVIMPAPSLGASPASGGSRASGAMLLGIVLVLAGVSIAFYGISFLWWMTSTMFRFGWPAALIAGGVLIILAARRR